MQEYKKESQFRVKELKRINDNTVIFVHRNGSETKLKFLENFETKLTTNEPCFYKALDFVAGTIAEAYDLNGEEIETNEDLAQVIESLIDTDN